MINPFRISSSAIKDPDLPEARNREWLEQTAPQEASDTGKHYLKSALVRRRILAAGILFSTFLVFLFARSASLQIIELTEYRNAAEINRVRVSSIRAQRGMLEDRTGIPLTRNVPRFQLAINPLDIPSEEPKRTEVLRVLANAAQTSLEDIEKRTTIARLPASPIILRTGLTLDEVYPLILETGSINGIQLETISMREYSQGEAFAHLLGYVGAIDANNAKEYLNAGYAINDLVGKTGLELALENKLRGIAGRRYAEVDAKGKVQLLIAEEKQRPGANVRLTIDSGLQNEVNKLLTQGILSAKASRGAAIVLNPLNGEILALVSYPTYDNNLFTIRTNEKEQITRLFSDENNPLFPRATHGTYPPGSTIKLVISAAALDAEVITPYTTFLSAGGIRVSEWFFPDWKAGGHGLTNVGKALAESVNTFFYIIGGGYEGIYGLGIEKLTDYLKLFGFGKPTGIEIPGEASGLIPTPEWKAEVKGERWYIGDTYHLAIGQGDILVTPLQIVQMTAYFANGGGWVRPHLVIKTLNHENIKALNDSGPQIKPQHVQVIREGLRDAVRFGSARALQELSVSSAGKTGTAQWSSKNDPHAWFTGWAPYDNPEIVVTVLIEEGGEGSRAAVSVAKEIIKWWNENNSESRMQN